MNQYLVLTLDALLHLGSVFVLGFLVSIVVKLFSRGHVDFRLLGGLFIVLVLGVIKIYLESKIAGFLPGVTPDLLFGIMLSILVIVAAVLIYRQYSVPLLGALISAIVVVALQMTAALGVPKLSFYLMPEGERFAEYAGLVSEQTHQLMEQAKNFEKKEGPSVWQQALSALSFFTSEEQSKSMSRDFASGIEVYKERKALMDSMTDDELAAYRKAMSEFMQEQGIAEDRYSLSNLKNVQPEDLANMASFMKELNSELGIEDTEVKADIPSSADSLRQISQNLKRSELSGHDKEIFKKLLSLIDQEDFETGIEQARAELAELKKDLPVGALLFSHKLDAMNSGGQVGHRHDEVEIQLEVDSVNAINQVETGEPTVYVPRDLTGYVEHPIQFGVVLLPPNMVNSEKWIQASKAIACKGWFIGDGQEIVAKVVVKDRVLGVGDRWISEYQGQRFVFHLDDVTAKGIHLSAME